jgi:isocitrate dehydrogenase (NAD+)
MPAQSKTKLPATLIPGDGIGPEIVKSAVDILEALGSPFEWDVQQGGLAAIEESRDPLPQTTLDSIRRTRLALKGPLTTPIGGGFRSINVRLREEFGLYANVRPVRSMVPGGRFDDIDIVLVRENLGGLYVAFEHYIPIGDDPHAVAISTGVNTREGSRKIIEFAFDYALKKRTQEGDRRAQGQCPEGVDRRVSRSGTRGCEEIRGQGPDGRSHRRCDRDAARHESLAVRRYRHHQFVR